MRLMRQESRAQHAGVTNTTAMSPYIQEFLNASGYTTFQAGQGDIRIFLAGLIQVALSIVGVIFFIMVLYGGYLWLTAGGNDEQVKKAQQFISRAIVGFMVTLAALIITRAVLTRFTRAHLGGPRVEVEF